MKIGQYYKKLEEQRVLCNLCPHGCIIPNGGVGRCRVRENHDGVLYASTYGCISSYGVDPIEKKPLYHFYPGKKIVSFGSFGCNLSCQFCQNYEISQCIGESVHTTAQDLVDKSLEVPDTIGIAATYNEPSIQFEFLMDVFELNSKYNRKNVMVSNGYIERSPLSELALVVDAFNIDLKGYSNKFYGEICGGKLEPVLETIEYLYDRSHLELTFMLIPGLNDDPGQMAAMFEKIGSISKEIPLHISRYFPNYKLTLPPTSYEAVIEVQDLARKHLDHVYVGNAPGINNETICKSCGYSLIERSQGSISLHFQDNRCPSCGRFHHIRFD